MMMRTPHIGSRKILVARCVKDDVRQHAVVPLALDQLFELPPGPGFIEGRPAERHKGRIPVPLEGIETVGRNGVAAPVIVLEDVAGGGNRYCHELFPRVSPLSAFIHTMRCATGARPISSPAACAASGGATTRII